VQGKIGNFIVIGGNLSFEWFVSNFS